MYLCQIIFGFLIVPSLISHHAVVYAETMEVVDVTVDVSTKFNFSFDQRYLLNVSGFHLSCPNILVNVLCEEKFELGIQPSCNDESCVNGSQLGVIVSRSSTNITSLPVYFKFLNECNSSKECLVVASQYKNNDPLPGGCNIVHQMMNYPMLDVTYSDTMATIKFSPANVGSTIGDDQPPCDLESPLRSRLVYDIYLHFLSQPIQTQTSDCDVTKTFGLISSSYNETFFKRSVSDLKIMTLEYSEMTRYYVTTIPCSIMLTYVKVRDPLIGTSSLYVPTFIKSSPPANKDFSIGMSVVVGLVGIILCFAGHRYFAFELFTTGTFFFVIITSLVVETIETFVVNQSIKSAIVLGVGLFGGVSIALLWMRFGKAALFSLYIGFLGGFVFASIVFATPLINVAYLQNQVVFVLIYLCVMALYVLLLIVIVKPHIMCIVTSSLCGSYLFVASLSSGVYLCSSLGNFLTVIIKKMAKKKFVKSIVVHPLHELDYIFIALWVFLFFLGLAAQMLLTKGKPPFPLTKREQYKLDESRVHNELAQENSDTSNNSSIRSSLTSLNYEGDISDQPPDYSAVFEHDRLFSNSLSH